MQAILGLRHFYDSTTSLKFSRSNKQYFQTFINEFIMLKLSTMNEVRLDVLTFYKTIQMYKWRKYNTNTQ